MPIITIQLAVERSPELAAAVASLVHDRTVHTLRKQADLVAVAVQFIAPEDWTIGGRTLAAVRQRSAFVDVRVTDETNTKDEKARFIVEVFEGLQRVLGDLHPHSYIHVHDVRAAAYGYGGRTQEARYHDRA